MSAASLLTASINPLFSAGINLYQGQALSLKLNDVITAYFAGAKVVSSLQGGNFGNDFVNYIRISAATVPAGIQTSGGLDRSVSILAGTPTTLGSSTVLFKVELYDSTYNGPNTSPLYSPLVRSVGYISVPIHVIAVPTTMTPDPEPSVILTQEINAVRGVTGYFALTAISYGTVYWTATGLPAGFNMANNQIQGRSTEIGTTTISVTARYQEAYNSPYRTETKEIPLIVSENYETAEVVLPPSFTPDGSIDLFCDLQSMALSLDLPKLDQILYDTQTVIKPNTKQLVVKPDQTLKLNLRFTKGITLVDPDPESLRFGIGTKIGGPLLMFGDEFTKVGTGSNAYYQLRVTSDASEFSALELDYYDEDAVESPTPGEAVASTADAVLSGICELEFTTGTGAEAATYRSDNLPVTIRRSLLASI